MFKQALWRRLEEVSYRYRRLRRRVALAVVWLLAAAVGLALLLVSGASVIAAAMLVTVSVFVAIVARAAAQRPAKDHRWVARRIEAHHPELNSVLIAAVELQPLYGQAGFGFLQESVLRDALARGQGQKWSDVAPSWKAAVAQAGQLAALAALIAVAILLIVREQSSPAADAAAARPRIAAGASAEVVIEPGDVEIERGTSLLVLARFAKEAPAEAELLVSYPSNDVAADEPAPEEMRLAMSRGLDDPLFGARVAEVVRDLQYQVLYTGGESRPFHVKVFDFPALVQADAKLKYPEYTALPEAVVQDTRRVTAVEGTELTLTCLLNKPVAMAWLQGEGGAKINLAADSQDPKSYSEKWVLKETARWKLHLVDREGRSNKEPPEFSVRVTENRPPDMKFVFPAGDVEASPLEEVDVEASAIDDFGLSKVAVAYSLASGEEQEAVLIEDAAGRQPQTLKHKIELESLKAAPDQLLTYYLWAEDVGADGQARRVYSDMFFAEVRPFEEIYRQGEQPTEGEMAGGEQGMGQGQGLVSSELLELQKQIVAAEWKLIRRETDKITAEYPRDTDLLIESQQAALAQAEEAESQLASPELASDLETVRKSMQQAIDHLKTAKTPPSVATHRLALAAEQAAYQGLLKLRAREFQVIRNSQRQQGGGGGGGGGNRSERQLQQLELKDDANRYETQRAARSAATEQQREIRQTQNRLRELARRQEDVNRQLKELQSALEQAQTPEEREEAERRLKRLRDQQQQLLRDVDDLESRLEQSENQQQMAPAEQQLEETRENVRKASEALEQGQVSQALASGTRAEQELRELRDEFRREAANQFSEEMRDIRDQARQLDQTQQDLSRRMNEMEQARTTNLRDRNPREDIEQGLQEQQSRLDQLYEQMRETVQEAEIPEPLLSRQLYDSLRTAQQQQLGERIDRARQLLDAGLPDEARQEEAPVREGLSELREGVEEAAESVLGDETEALKQARDELSELSQQLGEEVDRKTGQERTGEEKNSGQDGQEEQDERQEGQGGENPQQSENDRQGESQQPPSEQSQPGGQNQPGEQNRPGQQDQSGQQPQPGQQGENGQPGQAGQPQDGSPRERGGLRERAERTESAEQNGGQRNGGGGPDSAFDRLLGGGGFEEDVLTGEEFLEWSDRLRDVEEMLEDPELRSEAARIRERARDIRAEFKRHSAEPNWSLVRQRIAEPLTALRDRVAEELRRKQNQDSLAPIDRDPTPSQFQERVRRYYERLGDTP